MHKRNFVIKVWKRGKKCRVHRYYAIDGHEKLAAPTTVNNNIFFINKSLQVALRFLTVVVTNSSFFLINARSIGLWKIWNNHKWINRQYWLLPMINLINYNYQLCVCVLMCYVECIVELHIFLNINRFSIISGDQHHFFRSCRRSYCCWWWWWWWRDWRNFILAQTK